MTVKDAKVIVRCAYPKATCCELWRGGFWIYTRVDSRSNAVAYPVIHNLSRGEAWKHAAQYLLKKSEAA